MSVSDHSTVAKAATAETLDRHGLTARQADILRLLRSISATFIKKSKAVKSPVKILAVDNLLNEVPLNLTGDKNSA